MPESQDFHPIDELFHKTFDQLPETPAANQWDKPSDRVWDHVQKQITRPGTPAIGVWIVAALALGALALAAWWFIAQGGRPSPEPAPTPALEQTPAVSQPEPAPSQPDLKMAPSPAPSQAAGKTKRPKPDNTQTPAVNSQGERPGNVAQPLPGEKPQPRNTDERQRNGG